MKPSHLLLSVLLLLVSCAHLETTTHNATSRKSVNKEIPSKAEVFQYVYQADGDSYRMDIHWIDSSTIEFDFVADMMPCVFEQKGIARKHPLLDTEIDEDPDGISIPYDEYFVNEKSRVALARLSIYLEFK
ncbi:MAG: hypothetical protein N4A41_13440 [Crocinitomicaceae bacterium]|jgi:hypothetical protein|nr:hypothetical protein [Crocinitomicaceae bacterium]